MPRNYSVQTCRELEARFRDAGVVRPMRVVHHELGSELTFDVRGVVPDIAARVRLEVDKFVGGGFAGQVYRVRLLDLDSPQAPPAGLKPGKHYAMKILVPPSRLAKGFRDAIHWLAFQSPYQLQVNPAAARAGALWQKLIRRGAGVRFGDERAVVDVHATFVDPHLGACGELSEWIDGRTWWFEVDDRLIRRWRWRPGRDDTGVGSPEYRAKKTFMAEMVKLMHEMGAGELARQYEWWTCKSQPNVLKRKGTEADPAAGLTAVDFRPGLALLAYLPMSPGDLRLIARGLARGRLVQFDRGDLDRLSAYAARHADRFADMEGAIEELHLAERAYRDSMVDLTHNHVRLLYDRRLWAGLSGATVGAWRVRNQVDAAGAARLGASRVATFVFFVLGLIPLLGPMLQRLLGRGDRRRHLVCMLTSWRYLARAITGRMAETLICWHRDGRINAPRARWLAHHPPWLLANLPFCILPARLHRMLTNRRYMLRVMKYLFVRPVMLYFKASARQQWMHEMREEGKRHHMLTEADADVIESQMREPFVQKYLKCLAVHICTLPVTQVVSVMVALWYKGAHNLSWDEAWDEMLLILAAFQLTPISPGSLVRGLYVVYLVVRERNFKDYNIAVFLSFFKYIGYLAFPIQMAYRYPALARFMAARWATGAVHAVPVFGERGALMEHGVFDLFYNFPLTLRRRSRIRQQRRRVLPVRSWHVLVIALACAGALVAAPVALWALYGYAPGVREIWYAFCLLPALGGAGVAVWAGGASISKRIAMGAAAGVIAAGAYAALRIGIFAAVAPTTGAATFMAVWKRFSDAAIWPAFVMPLFGAIGAIVAEMIIPEPKTEPHNSGGMV